MGSQFGPLPSGIADELFFTEEEANAPPEGYETGGIESEWREDLRVERIVVAFRMWPIECPPEGHEPSFRQSCSTSPVTASGQYQ